MALAKRWACDYVSWPETINAAYTLLCVSSL